MAIPLCEVSITRSPLELPARGNDSASGAVVDFWGMVRALEEGKEITGIEYEAHLAMAEHQMRQIAEIATGKFGLAKVVIRHRIGFVPVTQASVVVHVESAHRSGAYSANQWIMDELKRTVPIWKHPVFKERDASGGTPAGKLPGSLDPSAARA